MSDKYFDQAKGRVKEAVGFISGDEKLRREGAGDQAGAHVRQAAGRVIDRARVAFRKAT